ncbi:MAG: adenosylcobinamide-GDP ribazoletransferase, partial [Oscillospiraceae bacterium]|nr:adenosylcobinamide-GDP ribazoletransferase [Oscillospiraceae bacterium]
MLKSLCSAFLMYSRIPVPQVEWKEENRRYSLCFFPLVGAVIAALIILWWKLCRFLSAGSLFLAVGCTVIPVL